MLNKWARSTAKLVAHGALTKGSVEHTLATANLPVLAGPFHLDGQLVRTHPNDSLLALSFQQPHAHPMQPVPPGRHALSDSALRALSFSSSSSSGGRGAVAGPLRLVGRLDELVNSRLRLLNEDATVALNTSRAAKRKIKEGAGSGGMLADANAYAAGASSHYAAAAGGGGGALAPSPAVVSGGGINAFKISLKRKADDGSGSGDAAGGGAGAAYVSADTTAEGERKKKKSKKKAKDESFEV
jgi:hypothetical protein